VIFVGVDGVFMMFKLCSNSFFLFTISVYLVNILDVVAGCGTLWVAETIQGTGALVATQGRCPAASLISTDTEKIVFAPAQGPCAQGQGQGQGYREDED